MEKVLFITGLFFMAVGCKKPHTSYWQVNKESFSSNKSTFYCSPGGAVFSSNSHENGFDIVFIPGIAQLPQSGGGSIDIPRPGSGGTFVTFYYQNKAYGVPTRQSSTAIQFSASGKKAILTLEPTWLKTSDTATTDSILVQGKLSEP